MKLTVYHDGQFWVGVFEEIIEGRLKASRYVFGSEPKDEEILELINKNRIVLTDMSSQFVEVNELTERKINPKRLSREVAREMKKVGISTKAQQSLQLEREKFKTERKIISRQLKEELEEKKWQMKRQKLKEKHRGR